MSCLRFSTLLLWSSALSSLLFSSNMHVHKRLNIYTRILTPSHKPLLMYPRITTSFSYSATHPLMSQRLTRMDEVLHRVIEALANDRDNGDTILFMFGDHGMTDRYPPPPSPPHHHHHHINPSFLS